MPGMVGVNRWSCGPPAAPAAPRDDPEGQSANIPERPFPFELPPVAPSPARMSAREFRASFSPRLDLRAAPFRDVHHPARVRPLRRAAAGLEPHARGHRPGCVRSHAGDPADPVRLGLRPRRAQARHGGRAPRLRRGQRRLRALARRRGPSSSAASIQGAGAISGVAIAMAADLTRPSQRTKAMAIIGSTIGVAFAGVVRAGALPAQCRGRARASSRSPASSPCPPWRSSSGSCRTRPPPGTGRRACPSPRCCATGARCGSTSASSRCTRSSWRSSSWCPCRWCAPACPAASHWDMYLGAVGTGFVLMLPVRRGPATGPPRARRLPGRGRRAGRGPRACWPSRLDRLWPLGAGLVIFFAAFNVLEAKLPALVSKAAPPAAKGAASGVYSSVQFLGTFVGAAAGRRHRPAPRPGGRPCRLPRPHDRLARGRPGRCGSRPPAKAKCTSPTSPKHPTPDPGRKPWHPSTKSSSSATSAAIPRRATCPTAAPSPTCRSPPRNRGRTRTARSRRRPNGTAWPSSASSRRSPAST